MSIILAVAAHPDDEVLGAGGSLARHVEMGDEVHILYLGEGPTSRESASKDVREEARKCAKASAKKLGISKLHFENFPDNQFDQRTHLELAQTVYRCVEQIHAEIILTHHYADLNVDHRYASEAVQVAGRSLPGSSVKEIYFWENLSSSEWGVRRQGFWPQMYVDIEKQFSKKLAAMKEYKDELKDFPHPRSLKGIQSLAEVRGMEAGLKLAEAFEVFRLIKA